MPTEMMSMQTALAQIEKDINERNDLATQLKKLRAISSRVDELIDRINDHCTFPEQDPNRPKQVGFGFQWPSTEAPPSESPIPESRFDLHKGMFQHLGYRVGYSGLSQTRRRSLLSSTFEGELP